jgi:hypothetical protein
MYYYVIESTRGVYVRHARSRSGEPAPLFDWGAERSKGKHFATQREAEEFKVSHPELRDCRVVFVEHPYAESTE